MTFDAPDGFDAADPDSLLFGPDDEVDAVPAGPTRRERTVRRRRRRRFMFMVVGLVVVLVVGGGYLAYRHLSSPADYSGTGTGSVVIQVQPGDGADAIGSTLQKSGVVATAGAFSRAAAQNSQSASIQPGFYRLRKHMSASSALTLMLDPTAHLVSKLTVPEGWIEPQVLSGVATALKVPLATVQAAAKNIPDLGLPDGYATVAGGALASPEGFLYPATYNFDPDTTPAEALQQMTSAYTLEDRSIAFANDAKKVHLAPYAALIIASIAQAEAKFPADMPRVARVVLNRLAAGMPLQIDATSAYAAKLAGDDPTSVNYATIDSPYNTYTHDGLPPTPIGNPGESALTGAVTPASGNWLYYVNSDAAGNLFFTNDPNAFEAAVQTCQAHNWGCG